MQMKKVVGLVAAMGMCGSVLAADVALDWDAVEGADSYKLYRTEVAASCLGSDQVWTLIAEETEPTAALTGQPEDGLLLYRVSAVRGAEESVRTWSGAWYAELLRPIATPGGTGIQ